MAAAYGHHMGHYHQQPQPQPQPLPGYAVKPQQQQQPHKQEEIRTLWAGDLHHWMDEPYLHACFAPTGQVSLSFLFCSVISFFFFFFYVQMNPSLCFVLFGFGAIWIDFVGPTYLIY